MTILDPNAPPPAGGDPAAPPNPAAGTPAAGAPSPGGQQPAAPRPRVQTSALPDEALSARLARERAKAYRDLGVEDPAAFKAKQAADQEELARLREERAAQERAKLSDQEKLAADLAAERALREQAESKALRLEEDVRYERAETAVRSAALKYVDPEMLDYARLELKLHVKELEKTDPKKVKNWEDADFDRFFRDLVKKKPRLAPAPAAPPADPKAPPAGAPKLSGQRPAPRQFVPRRPAGSPPLRQPPAPAAKQGAGADANGKTVKPGAKNSMTSSELNEHLKSKGMRPWH